MEALAQTVNLLLLDDHAMFRQSMARVLEKEADFRVVGQCGTTAEAMAILQTRKVSVVLLDVDLGPERALDFVTAARRKGFDGQILVVTAGVSGPEAVQLVQAGIAGILHKQHSTEALCQTLRKVAAGEVCLEADYLGPLFRSLDRTRIQQRPRLTDRDKAVLRFIFQGLTNKEIGGQLGISEGAVKASLRLLMDKIGVRTRAQLVKAALEEYRDQL